MKVWMVLLHISTYVHSCDGFIVLLSLKPHLIYCLNRLICIQLLCPVTESSVNHVYIWKKFKNSAKKGSDNLVLHLYILIIIEQTSIQCNYLLLYSWFYFQTTQS